MLGSPSRPAAGAHTVRSLLNLIPDLSSFKYVALRPELPPMSSMVSTPWYGSGVATAQYTVRIVYLSFTPAVTTAFRSKVFSSTVSGDGSAACFNTGAVLDPACT